MQRRGFLLGLGALIAAPAVIRTPGLLMPIKPTIELLPLPKLADYSLRHEIDKYLAEIRDTGYIYDYRVVCDERTFNEVEVCFNVHVGAGGFKMLPKGMVDVRSAMANITGAPYNG